VPGRPYVFVVMGTFLRETSEIQKPLEDLARVSYEYFSRRATISAYGRKLGPG
jgi:hypothetical protein